jgi:hypothetical protein
VRNEFIGWDSTKELNPSPFYMLEAVLRLTKRRGTRREKNK